MCSQVAFCSLVFVPCSYGSLIQFIDNVYKFHETRDQFTDDSDEFQSPRSCFVCIE